MATLEGEGIEHPLVFAVAAAPPGRAPLGVEALAAHLRHRLNAKRLHLGRLLAGTRRTARALADAAGLRQGGTLHFEERWAETLEAVAASLAVFGPTPGVMEEAICSLEDLVGRLAAEGGGPFAHRLRHAFTTSRLEEALRQAAARMDAVVPPVTGRRRPAGGGPGRPGAGGGGGGRGPAAPARGAAAPGRVGAGRPGGVGGRGHRRGPAGRGGAAEEPARRGAAPAGTGRRDRVGAVAFLAASGGHCPRPGGPFGRRYRGPGRLEPGRAGRGARRVRPRGLPGRGAEHRRGVAGALRRRGPAGVAGQHGLPDHGRRAGRPRRRTAPGGAPHGGLGRDPRPRGRRAHRGGGHRADPRRLGVGAGAAGARRRDPQVLRLLPGHAPRRGGGRAGRRPRRRRAWRWRSLPTTRSRRSCPTSTWSSWGPTPWGPAG